MSHNFLPHTDDQRQAMLKAMGLSSIDELFDDIPAELRQKCTFEILPKTGQDELSLENTLVGLANKNEGAHYANFLGGGANDRFIPMAVNTIASRSEFYTAYTPYQPEISQGTLQVAYEFQSMIAELTGLDVANASVYDGGSALTEAAFMALRATRRKTILVARTVHPDCRGILTTYAEANGTVSVHEFDPEAGPEALSGIDPKTVAAVLLQNPNYLGFLEDAAPWSKYCQDSGALLVIQADPISLALLEAPGNYGADVVVGDIQPLGNHLAYGGPYGGFMATKEKYLRQLPGRVVGKALDKNGRPCFTLTLQTREQHIRREKATSNICTSQSLNLLKATVYLSLVGPQGLAEVAEISVQRAHALAEQLTQLPGVALLCPQKPFFSEFTVTLPVPVEQVLSALEAQKILGGIPVGRFYPEHPNALLIAVTERSTPEQIQRYVATLADMLGQPTPAEKVKKPVSKQAPKSQAECMV